MENKRNIRLIIKILTIGLIIAWLSYLFHPEVGHLSVMFNGQPVSSPLVRFAAIPTFLAIMGLAAILTFMLFFGIGIFIFLATLFVALMACFLIAPYFWPVLIIIALIIAPMSFDHQDKS